MEQIARHAALVALGIDTARPVAGASNGAWLAGGPERLVHTPTDDGLLATVTDATPEHLDQILATAKEAFLSWRNVPAPRRGEVVRQWGERLRVKPNSLITWVDFCRR